MGTHKGVSIFESTGQELDKHELLKKESLFVMAIVEVSMMIAMDLIGRTGQCLRESRWIKSIDPQFD
jgi:hypothetical protein